MTKRQLIWLLPFALIGGMIWAIQSGRLELPIQRDVLANQAEPVPPGLPVNVLAITELDSFAQQRRYTGTVRARRRSDLGFELSGRIAKMFVDEGAIVRSGQVIATLDTESLVAKRSVTIASRDQARALWNELKAGPRPETIDAARARVLATQSELNRAKLSLERRRGLREGQAISVEEYDHAVFSEQSAIANHEAARQQLAELLAGTRLEKIDAQRAVVVQWAAAVSEVDVMLAKSRLIAPFAGTVTRRYLDPGAIAAASSPVVRIIDQQHLEAWIGLPVPIVAGMRVGDPKYLYVDEIRYDAVVSAIIPELDKTTRTQTVLLSFGRGAGNAVVSGQLCEIAEETVVTETGFWIPTSALSKGIRGLWSVMVVVLTDDGTSYLAEKRDIEIINTNENGVLARGTIVSGDLIVVDGIHRIADGQRVIPNESK